MPNKYWWYDTCIYDSWHADREGMPGVYFINFLQPKEDLEVDIQEVVSGIFKGKKLIWYLMCPWVCIPESLHFFALQKSWTSGLNNNKPTNFSLFSIGPNLQSGWDNDFQLNFKKWPLATTWGHNLSYMNEVKIQNVCDMEYISNLLLVICYIQMGLNLNLG